MHTDIPTVSLSAQKYQIHVWLLLLDFHFLSLFHLSTVSLTSPLFQKSSIKIFRKALLLSSPKTRSKKKKKKKCAQIENKTNGRGFYLFPELKKSQKKISWKNIEFLWNLFSWEFNMLRKFTCYFFFYRYVTVVSCESGLSTNQVSSASCFL